MGRSRPLSASVFRALPKVELHLHLEGGLSCTDLASVTGASRRSLERAYRFRDFAGFLAAYKVICRAFTRPEQFEAAVSRLGSRLRRDGVVHAEVFFSATVHRRNGIDYAALVGALERGAERVQRRGGPTLLFIADGVRQWGPRDFRWLVRQAVANRSPRVVAVGIGGDEGSRDLTAFAADFRVARRAGLAAVVHAGETGEASSVRDALRQARPRRIGHGIAAAADPRLLRRLAREGVPLDVCPTSNRRTGVVQDLSPGTLLALAAAGVRVTLSTDDPGLFRSTLSGEYSRLAGRGVPGAQLRQWALNAARASLHPPSRRAALVRRIRQEWAGMRDSGPSRPATGRKGSAPPRSPRRASAGKPRGPLA